MTLAQALSRRKFLIGSVVVLGGVAFGSYSLLRGPKEHPLGSDAPDDAMVFNPWVVIDARTVTLIAPHADFGQGVTTMQTALIAEELDLEPGQYEISFGGPSAAYANTALADLAIPFATSDRSALADGLRAATDASVAFLGVQITGGSTSAPDSFEKLRMAGAMAREALLSAAAQKTGLPRESLRSHAGAVLLPDGTGLPYTTLATLAASQPPAANIALRPAESWRLLGKPLRNVNDTAIVIGALRYGIDLEAEGLAHATLLLNPRKSGPALGYDAARALSMRGVERIVEIADGLAIVADNTWRAFQAADALDVDWPPNAHLAEQADHWAALEAALSQTGGGTVWRDDGDAAQRFAEAPQADRIEASYRVPYVAHQPLEPLSVMIKASADRLDIWAAHQLPGILRRRVAWRSGLSMAQVQFHQQIAGGSFGHRFEFTAIDGAVDLAMQMPGRPVKVTLRREVDFAQDHPRPIGMARAQGVVRAGRVEACQMVTAGPSLVGSTVGRLGLPYPLSDSQLAIGLFDQPYALPDFRVAAHQVDGLAPVGFWRSIGGSGNTFFLESFLDEMIHAAGGDPVAERLRLLTDPLARKVLEAAAEMANWGRKMGPGQGQGVAFSLVYGVPVAEVVEVTETDRGIRIDHVHGACDAGPVLDPVNFTKQVEGGVLWGLGHAINCKITYAQGQAEQANYDDHPGLRLGQAPRIDLRILQNAPVLRGIGEPPVPPAAPALANAIFAATGQRLREMPFADHINFA
jgi:isoquinoline 1-oxidoreductase subunit beta